MKNNLKILLGGFVIALISFILPIKVAAEETNNLANTTRTYNGILIANQNSKYQYTLQGTNIDLILGTAYNGWAGKNVAVTVTYNNDGTTF